MPPNPWVFMLTPGTTCISASSPTPGPKRKNFLMLYPPEEKLPWSFRICSGALTTGVVPTNLGCNGCLTAAKKHKGIPIIHETEDRPRKSPREDCAYIQPRPHPSC